jgi:hypothetical protein
LGDLLDDVQGAVVDQSPVERGRALNAHEPVIFEAADVVGEVLGIALGASVMSLREQTCSSAVRATSWLASASSVVIRQSFAPAAT